MRSGQGKNTRVIIMTKITTAQCRKIHALERERGIDSDMLHAHVYSLTKKESLKNLSITEAINVIDSLSGTDTGRITYRQKDFLLKLCIKLKWTDDKEQPNIDILNGFIKGQTGAPDINWLTKKQASKVIEAMKAMAEKDRRKNENG